VAGISAQFKGQSPASLATVTLTADEQGAEFTLEPGPFPGHGWISLAPDTVVADIPNVGCLILSDGTTTIYVPGVWTYPEDATTDERGVRIRVPLQDSRCRWGFGGLVKEYNVRHDWQPVPVRVTISDMLADVFYQLLMGTPATDVEAEGDIPDFAPEIRWEWATPAEAIQELCDKAGLIVWPETFESEPGDLTQGRFVIMPLSTSKSLPAGASVRASRSSSAPNLVPKTIKIVGDRTINQITTYELEPVGAEADGTIKPLADLSYGPGHLTSPTGELGVDQTWGQELLTGFANVKALDSEAEAALAEKWALRVYRLTLPEGCTDPSLILNHIVDTETDENGNYRKRRPYVTGAWCEEKDGAYSNRYSAIGDVPADPTVDGVLIKFEKPIYYGFFASTDPLVPHDITPPLGFAFTFAYESAPDDSGYYEYEYDPPNPTTDDVQIVRVPGLRLERKYNATTELYEDQNHDELDEIALELALAEAAKYADTTPAGYSYVGIVQVEPDGATRRIQFRASVDGAGTETEKNFERLVGGRLPLAAKTYLMDLARGRKDLQVP